MLKRILRKFGIRELRRHMVIIDEYIMINAIQTNSFFNFLPKFIYISWVCSELGIASFVFQNFKSSSALPCFKFVWFLMRPPLFKSHSDQSCWYSRGGGTDLSVTSDDKHSWDIQLRGTVEMYRQVQLQTHMSCYFFALFPTCFMT